MSFDILPRSRPLCLKTKFTTDVAGSLSVQEDATPRRGRFLPGIFRPNLVNGRPGSWSRLQLRRPRSSPRSSPCLSSVVVQTAKAHPHVGDDAVEHAHQAGDTTFHTRANHCNFDLINVEAEIQAHRLELHGVLCNRLEESSPKKDDSVMLDPRTCSKARGSGKSKSRFEAFHTPLLKLKPRQSFPTRPQVIHQASCSAPEIVVNKRLRLFNLQHPHERDEETRNHNANLKSSHLARTAEEKHCQHKETQQSKTELRHLPPTCRVLTGGWESGGGSFEKSPSTPYTFDPQITSKTKGPSSTNRKA